MKQIKELSEMIEEELEDAEKYAKHALKLRESEPTLAKTFYDLSTDEMRHMGLLHDEVKKLIEKHRREHGEPPAPMMAVYDYLHQKHIDKAAHIKVLQAEYRAT
jgi:rubrerythrin